MPPSYDEGEEALAFLSRQRLPPTPINYMLAYIVLTEPKSPIASAVKSITDGGVRIGQAEADEILGLYAGSTARPDFAGSDGAGRYAFRHQALKLSEIASSAAAASGAFTRDMTADSAALYAGATDTAQIVLRMIERSQRAEAELSASAREVDTLRQELEVARGDAARDHLTGLPNRRAVERHLLELAEHDRVRVVGICDVDRFKLINDRYGHSVGDRVLKEIASVLKHACAPHFVGRWGGEEFILVLVGGDKEQGVRLLDQARADLSAREFKLRETDEPIGVVSFSAGVAVARGDHGNSLAAIRQADASLYRAKAAGRNRVVAS